MLIDIDPDEEDLMLMIDEWLPGWSLVADYVLSGDPSVNLLKTMVKREIRKEEATQQLLSRLETLSGDDLIWFLRYIDESCFLKAPNLRAIRKRALNLLLKTQPTETDIYLLCCDGEFGHGLGNYILDAGVETFESRTLQKYLDRFQGHGAIIVKISEHLLANKPSNADLLAIVKACPRYRATALDRLLVRNPEGHYLYWSLGYSTTHDEIIVSRLLARAGDNEDRKRELARFCLTRKVATQSELMAQIILDDQTICDYFMDQDVLMAIVALQNRFSVGAAERLLSMKSRSWRKEHDLRSIRRYLPSFRQN